MKITPSQDDLDTALRAFLVLVLSDLPAKDIFRAQVNRVPEPRNDDFCQFNPRERSRISWNVDGSADVVFVGSIDDDVLTITEITFGEVKVGATVFAVDIEPSTLIVAQLTGPTGGVGTYTVSVEQELDERTMASGATTLMQETELVYQLDFHGPAGGDYVQIAETVFQDGYAVEYFANEGAGLSPLYCGPVRQIPFINGEQQYEDRWVLEVHFQVNQIVTVPQQFADTLAVNVVSVEANYQ